LSVQGQATVHEGHFFEVRGHASGLSRLEIDAHAFIVDRGRLLTSMLFLALSGVRSTHHDQTARQVSNSTNSNDARQLLRPWPTASLQAPEGRENDRLALYRPMGAQRRLLYMLIHRWTLGFVVDPQPYYPYPVQVQGPSESNPNKSIPSQESKFSYNTYGAAWLLGAYLVNISHSCLRDSISAQSRCRTVDVSIAAVTGGLKPMAWNRYGPGSASARHGVSQELLHY